MHDRKVCLFIAMSLDGYIAKPDGDISFLSIVEQEGEDYGYTHFSEQTDVVILGRKTYEKILSFDCEFPYGAKKVYVITHQQQGSDKRVKFYSGDLGTLIDQIKQEDGKNIYVDGGAEIISQLLKLDLIDEMQISVIPILIGDGIPLFGKGIPEQKLHLAGSVSFKKGLVQLHYKRN